jgi:hypothetical protein
MAFEKEGITGEGAIEEGSTCEGPQATQQEPQKKALGVEKT